MGDRIGVAVGCQRFAWPHFRLKERESPVIDRSTDGEAPESDKFASDLAVCIVPQIYDVDSVVGHLVAKEKKNLHTCLITIADLPEIDGETSAFLKKIMILPTEASPIPGSNILQPYAADDPRKEWDPKTKNPIAKGHMSLKQFTDITEMYVLQLLQSIRVEKYGVN